MRSCRPPLFRKRQFEPIIIVTCVRWYCRFSLSLRDLEELMAERGLAVDQSGPNSRLAGKGHAGEPTGRAQAAGKREGDFAAATGGIAPSLRLARSGISDRLVR
jgi:hypothetical protein